MLLLDEPTRGIDVGEQGADLPARSTRSSRRSGPRSGRAVAAQAKAVLLVSSYLPELLGVCDRIAVMCRGAPRRRRGRPPDWTEHALLMEATGAADAA